MQVNHTSQKETLGKLKKPKRYLSKHQVKIDIGSLLTQKSIHIEKPIKLVKPKRPNSDLSTLSEQVESPRLQAQTVSSSKKTIPKPNQPVSMSVILPEIKKQ